MTTMELEMEVAEIKTRLRRVENALREQSDTQGQVSPPPNLPLSNEELLGVDARPRHGARSNARGASAGGSMG